MDNNIVTAVFNGSRSTKTEYLWQYDYGQILKIDGIDLPELYEVHVSGSASSNAVTVLGSADGVAIPDEFLTKSGSITMYIYLHVGDSDGETEYQITIPVRSRFQPTHEEPTPVQQSEIEQLIASLNSATDKAEGYAEDAKESAAEASQSAETAEHWAELSAQHAESAGYIFCDVDNETGSLIVTTVDDLYDEMRLGINENTGELVVNVL